MKWLTIKRTIFFIFMALWLIWGFTLYFSLPLLQIALIIGIIILILAICRTTKLIN